MFIIKLLFPKVKVVYTHHSVFNDWINRLIVVDCAVSRREYVIFGYKGKQVRDQIHCDDVARLLLEFFQSPRCGEVYNLGGGRNNSVSILETIDILAGMGFPLQYRYDPKNRVGDHICYITDLAKVRSHFPAWEIKYSLDLMIAEIAEARSSRNPGSAELLKAERKV